ncbi:hypothetical protein K466DRAFT_662092 [Polyporus arcularius HHB13444]|uniref:Uncharacterized protein n=1 Tax=Polyporus arcularius HHB13444 TaxID=1314778 RepID=A0A5C3PHI1_9APHY|nr:hypothetical protein K466DRAFT_662092 [Polyporus arcularius HHB13444]
MTTVDPFERIAPIAGSRRPILVPAFPGESSASSHTHTPPSNNIPRILSFTSSGSRRKPAKVFKSPSADQPGEWEPHNSTSRKRGIAPYTRIAPRRASSSTDSAQSSSVQFSEPIRVAIRRDPPPLPLYHPLGPLAQALPKLKPSQFGLPDSLNVDDPDDQAEGDHTQGGSRTRRGPPKARDAVEEDAQSPGTPNGSNPDPSSKERNASPRKRRGGGAKRKRKDADDNDSVFPPPPKRTRNPRGAAANNSVPAAPSPLVGPAVVASDLVDDAPENSGEVEEAPEEPQAPKRTSRARKPRTRPTKRRSSSGSASTGTSVSVSIAAAAKAAAEAKATARAQPEDEAQPHDGEVNGVVGIERREEEEHEVTPVPAIAAAPGKEASPPEAHKPASSSNPPAPSVVQLETELQDVPMKSASPALVQSPSPISASIAAPARPSAIPPAATHRPTPAPLTSPPKEEREEGELSDE